MLNAADLPETKEPAAAQPVILCVDDEPSILSALRRLFRPQGIKVLLAASGRDGLALLEQEQVDLVISDMRMPEMDGAQFLEQVRTRWPAVVRVLLTGYADISSTVAAINRGEIHRYIAKPWDDQSMLLCVRDGLNRRRLEQQNRELLALTQTQNDQLQKLNEGLENRVRARTQEIEQVNGMLEQAYAQLQDNFLLSIQVFSGLLELRDGSLVGYSRQVASLALRTARRLKLGPPIEQDVHSAGLLHEIGKIGFPDAMLHKPMSSMSSEQVSRYKRHPLDAEAALMPLAQLHRVARFVRSQHERFDGKGFPDGLQGSEFPLPAQALAVASDYQALLSGRMAEKRYTPSEALSMVRGGTDTRYAKAVVEAFCEALKDAPDESTADRQVLAGELEVGMVLSRDLTGPQGTLLLAAGFVFDERVVRQVREFSLRAGSKMTLHVKR